MRQSCLCSFRVRGFMRATYPIMVTYSLALPFYDSQRAISGAAMTPEVLE